jgi:hypothetical protein
MRKAVILGAGFSYPLGLPLATQVLPWLRRRSEEDTDNPFTQEALTETDF